MQAFNRKDDGTKTVTNLTPAQQKRFAKTIKEIMKIKRKLASLDPLKDELQILSEELKAELVAEDIHELKDKNAVAIVAFPTKTEWDVGQLLTKLTGDELDQLCPRTPKAGLLVTRRNADEDFAARVATCYDTINGTPTLTVKAA
jgi:hypothetical protein